MSNQCNLYATNPMLAGVKSDYDLKMNQLYCNYAQSQPYGPNFSKTQSVYNKKACPFIPLSSAYEFNGAPSQVTRQGQGPKRA